jgi:hypothetical protein
MLPSRHTIAVCVLAAARLPLSPRGAISCRRAEGKAVQDLRDDLLGTGAGSDFTVLLRAAHVCRDEQLQPKRVPAARHQWPSLRGEAIALAQQFADIAKGEGLDLTPRRHQATKQLAALCPCRLSRSRRHAARPRHASLRHGPCSPRRARARERHSRRRAARRQPEVREISMRDGVETLLTLATAIRRNGCENFSPKPSPRSSRQPLSVHAKRVDRPPRHRAFTTSPAREGDR